MPKKKSVFWKVIAVTMTVMVLFSTVAYDLQKQQGSVYANLINQPLIKQLSLIDLKVRGQKMDLPLIKGISLDQKDKLQIDFYFDLMNRKNKLKTEEVKRNIRYFLGFLAMPEEKLWVNLSPYEKERVVDRDLGKLDIGKDFLVMDYLLKQLVAKLTSPKTKEGRKYWEKVYAAAEKIAGTRRIPINNFYPRKADFTKCVINVFNKVWIVPDIAEIYEHSVGAGSKPALNKQNKIVAFVKEARLKVMIEEDRVAYRNEKIENRNLKFEKRNKIINQVNHEAKEIFKRELLPIIEEEVNHGETFAVLRQLYYALILATYCKDKWNESKEYQGYIDSAKAEAIAYLKEEAKKIKDNVYQGYLESFRQGDRVVEGKRSYVSGGVLGMGVKQVLKVRTNSSTADFNSFKFNFGRGEKIRVTLQRIPNNKIELRNNKRNTVYDNRQADAQVRLVTGRSEELKVKDKKSWFEHLMIVYEGIRGLRKVVRMFWVYMIAGIIFMLPISGCDREQGNGVKIKSDKAPIERVEKIHKDPLAGEEASKGIDKEQEEILKQLEDRDASNRVKGLEKVLGLLEKEQIVLSEKLLEKIIELLGDWDVRAQAERILSVVENEKILYSKKFVRKLIVLLGDQNGDIQKCVLKILLEGLTKDKISYNEEIVEKLIGLLGDENISVANVLSALSVGLEKGQIEYSDKIVEKIIGLLDDNEALRLLSLGLLKGQLDYREKIVEKLMVLLGSKNWYVRFETLNSLSAGLSKNKVAYIDTLVKKLIVLLGDENINVRTQALSTLSVWANKGKITLGQEFFRQIKKVLFSDTLKNKDQVAILLSEIMRDRKDLVLRDDVRQMFNFILFRDVFKNLEEIIIEHHGYLKEKISKIVKVQNEEEIFKAANFNLFLYLLSLKQEYVSLDEKEEYLKCLMSTVDTLSIDKRLMALLGLGSVLKQLSQEEIGELKARVPELIIRIEGVSKSKESPDYAAIFDKKTNPNQEFNIMLYANLDPQLYADRFKQEGYDEKDSKTAGVKVYSKEVNEKRVSIRLDFVTNPGGLNNKNMLKYINNHKCHLIAYAGHTSMGKPFMHSFKNTPLEAFRKKIICLFSCSSARAFFWEFFKRSPGIDFIGTKTYASDDNDCETLLAIIDGVTSAKSWEEIKKNADEKIKKTAELKGYKELEDLFFPHQDASEYIYQDMGKINLSEIKYFHYNVDRKIELLNNLSFEFEMGFVDIDQISHEKVKAAVETDVRFILQTNPYLVESARHLKGVGFNIFEDDSRQVCTYNQSTGEVSVNVGYRNSSKEALAMMLIYQLNLEIAKSKNRGKITVWDKIRGLELAAIYLYSREQLRRVAPDFLRKFGYDSEKIKPADILKIFYRNTDESAKRSILEKLLKAIEPNMSLPEIKVLKGLGIFGDKVSQIRENRSLFEEVRMQGREAQYAYRQLGKGREKGEMTKSKVFSSGGVLDLMPMYLRKSFNPLDGLPAVVNPGGIDFRKKGFIKRKNINNISQEKINQNIKCDYSFSFQILSRCQL